MTTLQDVVNIGSQDRFLAVVSTLRADGTIQSSVVNAGVLVHPVGGADVVGFITYGKTKSTNLRLRPQLSITFRAGWQWAAVEGQAELIGPDDISPDIDTEGVRHLPKRIRSRGRGSRRLGRLRSHDGRTATHCGACQPGEDL